MGLSSEVEDESLDRLDLGLPGNQPRLVDASEGAVKHRPSGWLPGLCCFATRIVRTIVVHRTCSEANKIVLTTTTHGESNRSRQAVIKAARGKVVAVLVNGGASRSAVFSNTYLPSRLATRLRVETCLGSASKLRKFASPRVPRPTRGVRASSRTRLGCVSLL